MLHAAVTATETDNTNAEPSSSGKRKKVVPKKKPAKKAPKKKTIKGKETSKPSATEMPVTPSPGTDKPSATPVDTPTVAEGNLISIFHIIYT